MIGTEMLARIASTRFPLLKSISCPVKISVAVAAKGIFKSSMSISPTTFLRNFFTFIPLIRPDFEIVGRKYFTDDAKSVLIAISAISLILIPAA